MVHFLRKQKIISFAAALMALALAPAQAGPARSAAVAGSLLAMVRDNVARLEAAAPGNTAVLRVAGWSARGFLPLTAGVLPPMMIAPGIDDTKTGAVRPSLFKSVALPIRNLPAATQWRPVYAKLGQDFASDCAGPDCRTRVSGLEAAIDEARSARFVERLRLVNSTVNGMIGYAGDREIYGQLDYWATPSQTLKAGRGDCEDYAILKMAALKAAGIPVSSMSLVVLRDRERNLFHAVLAVATDRGHFILDNAHDVVLLDSKIARYQPLFSMSRDRYWLHGTRRSGDQMVASGSTPLRGIAPGEGPDALADPAPLAR